MNKLGLFLFAGTLVVALLVITLPEGTKANMDEAANMVEALRVLEQLDKYYSQIARPRFGRSIGLHRKGNALNIVRAKKHVADVERR
ncbi:neuropeptide F-like [Uloborus diversus]|uniref:neuropeptide F-like n=1 Tax=Uloborus diversus TaxID=327109 RepID=UPI00240A6F25|nr:neuropeptide F-like [Uloborus diversus]